MEAKAFGRREAVGLMHGLTDLAEGCNALLFFLFFFLFPSFFLSLAEGLESLRIAG